MYAALFSTFISGYGSAEIIITGQDLRELQLNIDEHVFMGHSIYNARQRGQRVSVLLSLLLYNRLAPISHCISSSYYLSTFRPTASSDLLSRLSLGHCYTGRRRVLWSRNHSRQVDHWFEGKTLERKHTRDGTWQIEGIGLYENVKLP